MAAAGVGVSRVVVVTGGTRGIGRAVAARFDAAGDRVIALGRAECDVTSEASVATCFDGIGAVDVLVNNAGVSASADVARTSLADWRAQIDVNATGAFLCTRAVLPGMRERDRGRIVTVASVAAHHGARYVSGYTASKHAVLGLTRSVATEVAGTGVTCNAVCPGYVRSDMTDQTIANIEARTGQDGTAALVEMTPLGRLIEPAEVAFAVAFFAADEAGAINGQTLIIDGGGVQG
jgi:NAD(P)-dependent dehydrogenase (short-subunit alcohol dehydrogenase family)